MHDLGIILLVDACNKCDGIFQGSVRFIFNVLMLIPTLY